MPEDGAEPEVGVAQSELSSTVPFWFGNAHMTSGYGALIDNTNDGTLGWTGAALPLGNQANAMALSVDGARSATGDATLTWLTYAQVSGDYGLDGPGAVNIDGYARVSGLYGQAGSAHVELLVRVRRNGQVVQQRTYFVAGVDSSFGEKTVRFEKMAMPIAHDFGVTALAGDALKYEIALTVSGSSSGTLSSAFVGIRDFGVLTNAVPNTSHTIMVSAP
jgi:hypothetical protein